MHESFRGVLSLVVLAGLTLPVLSQTGGVQNSGNGAAPRKPQPEHYTAELKETSVKTLADGTTIALESIMVIAKDSQGRSMMSNTYLGRLKDGRSTTYYSVSDPVAGTYTSWTSPGKKATVTTSHTQPTGQHTQPTGQIGCTVFFLTPDGYSMSAPQGSETTEPAKKVVGKFSSMLMRSSGPSDPQIERLKILHKDSTTEDLGTMTIQGVEALGQRFTWTTPAGAMGNDRPMVYTQESWITTGDNPRSLNVRQVSDDPQAGKSTTELQSLSLEEPDLSVFQSPEGYEIVTQEVHSAACPKELKQPEQ